jgi:hypothetical protein
MILARLNRDDEGLAVLLNHWGPASDSQGAHPRRLGGADSVSDDPAALDPLRNLPG